MRITDAAPEAGRQPAPGVRPRAILCWSGGKDCALALWHARHDLELTGLLTTVTMPLGRVSMHGVRQELLQAQAESLRLRLVTVAIPFPCSNDDYERAMAVALTQERQAGVNHVVCGDIYLEDVRRYREERLFWPGAGIFPIWGRPSRDLAMEFIALGFRAVVCCVDSQVLAGDFVGRIFDSQFLSDLPASIDPCGENGEFHTFVFDGPLFERPIPWRLGDRVLRDERFVYQDLLPE